MQISDKGIYTPIVLLAYLLQSKLDLGEADSDAVAIFRMDSYGQFGELGGEEAERTADYHVEAENNSAAERVTGWPKRAWM